MCHHPYDLIKNWKCGSFAEVLLMAKLLDCIWFPPFFRPTYWMHFYFLPNIIYIAHISRLQAFHCLHFLFIIGQSANPPPLRSLLRSVPKYTQPGSCCLTTNLPLCCHRYVLALARTCGSLQREIFRFTGCHLDKELKIIIKINK